MRSIQGYSYSCLLARLPEPLAGKVRSYGLSMPDERIYDDEDNELGREDKPHVTIKFGLHTTDPDKVKATLDGQSPFQVRLGPMSVFNSEDYTVIKLGVEGQGIHKLNRFVSDNFECTDTFPEYHPHCTVAYVKKDKLDPYWFNEYFTDRFEGKTVKFDKLIFSVPSGEKHEIPLTGVPVVEEDGMKSAARELLRVARSILIVEQYRALSVDRMGFRRIDVL